MTTRHFPLLTPGILSGLAPHRSAAPERDPARPARFVMQSHALGLPAANPRALVVATVIGIALFLLGRRLSE